MKGHSEFLDDIVRLSLGELKSSDFLNKHNIEIEKVGELCDQLLLQSYQERSPIKTECAMLLGFQFQFIAKSVKTLSQLLMEDWHTEHENIASVLQEFRDPISINSLAFAVDNHPPYLTYNNGLSLAIKCIWALGAINNPLALEKLVEISKSDVLEKRQCAQDQLKKNEK